ncbi:hypothetical protein TRAPUB_6955 [Trametes pubescens]|uniref:Protection of telomeres protein 1 n=1 Tax=Trametes pubescens TaxID=154538 RepID=A0A1M2V4N6_TRAPU|nr:hypothetical protein TRAPUB_6955 [Trametes pubescens]
MKRSAESGPSSYNKSPPAPHALIQAFPPDQKKKAGDICRKGSDGTGWVEGKVYQRGAPSGETWEFIMTAELGSRVQVLLSGSCSEHFPSLPIVVGAQVRIRTKGLVLEDLDEPPKLLLPKRFAWRGRIALHVHNPKTGEQYLVDTWADPSSTPPPVDDTSLDMDMASAPSVPKKRRRTPNPASADHDVELRGASPPSADVNGVIERIPPSDPMLVDHARVTNPTLEGEPVKKQAELNDSQSDSQNPQSLPSPPPELTEEPGTDEQTMGLMTSNNELEPAPEELPRDQPSTDNAAAAAPIQECQEFPVVDELSTVTAPPPPPLPAAPAAGFSGNSRKQTSRDRRKLKQLQKAGKLVDEAPAAKPSEAVADVDGEEHYWDEADTLPDDVLMDDIGQRQAAAEEVHIQPDQAERAATPVHGPQVIQPDEPLLDASHEAGIQESNDDPLESLRMGCDAGFITYTPLAQLPGAGMRHIIGVVDSAGVLTQTKKQEFMFRLVLYDPTNYGFSGLTVTLFEKAQKALPTVEAGDVLMLRAIQIDRFNNTQCATGPSFKGWQWAVFHVKSGMLSTAPADACASRHFKPEESELKFSIRLGDWWRNVSSNATSFAPDISLGGRRGREHKLIADATSDEYFDTTVEVLHGLRNDNGVYSVFVTDYTRHPAVSPTQGEWCPPRLAPYVLRIELWDSSAEVGPTMQAGEYYSIRNLRSRIGGGGYLESKMQEGDKIVKLDEDQLENQPRLAALLKRKRDWETEMNATGGVHEFPHKLIEEAEENCHFKCTVEVVHISPKDDFTYIYVTDYTARTDLVPVSASIASSTLADRVVRVELRDAQVDIAKNLEAGDFVAVRNLRLRPSGGGTLLAGRLGGDQRLITMLNPKANGNADLRALLSRKEEWTNAQTKSKREGKRTAARAARLAAETSRSAEASASGSKTVAVPRKGKHKHKGKQFTTLEDVRASEACPAVFRVRARAVDFFPDDLRDCTILRCTSCDETLPKTRRRCTKCDDAMEDDTAVAAFFQLWLRVADEEGTTLDVSIADERCSILEDLSPDDVHEDDGAFAMLVARLRPLLGGLLDVHEDEARRRPLAQDADSEPAPLMDLSIGSWLPEGEPDTPDARAYVVMKHALCEDDDT